MVQGNQVRNGKAFEYALATQYSQYLGEQHVNIKLVEDDVYNNAKRYYSEMSFADRRKFDYCAALTIDTMIRVEPGLTAVAPQSDCLKIYLNSDGKGEEGDVRDVVFERTTPQWAIGFSAKNNNDAVKHSRLSSRLDFGREWLGVPCSQTYWNAIKPIFDYLAVNGSKTWNDLGKDKATKVYIPLLKAFRDELLLINRENNGIPQKLIRYLIGKFSFYKIIKDDSHNMVIIKAFNIEGELNKSVLGIKPRFKTPLISLPTRIVEFEMKVDSDNTLHMILNGGWEVSFRIHNASTNVEQSLKFDVKLLGNPPILFTQYLFQDNEVD